MVDLVCLYYPQQLLPSLAAVKFLQKQKNFYLEKLIVFVWLPNGMAHALKENRKAFFKKALSIMAGTQLVFSDEIQEFQKSGHFTSVLKKAKILKKYFGQQQIARFYYSHDLTSDFISQAFMQGFPKSYKVSFGDGFGLFYDKKHFEKQFFPINDFSQASIKNVLSRIKRAWSVMSCSQVFDADMLLGILPQEASSNCFHNKHVQTIDKKIVLDLNNQFMKIFEQDDDVFDGEQKKYVFLMGSYSESKLMSLEQELNLYADVFAKHIPQKSMIMLKTHPAAHPEKLKQLLNRFENVYQMFEISSSDMPIEWMINLLNHAQVISFSYASISLKYLYDIQVIHALTQEQIDLYFYTKAILWMSESNQMYLDKIQDLENQFSSIHENA
ncbi:MAG TPA: hypothetical protein DCZ80_01505 [Legionellales bacterium]|nr:hypothetical protein [Legionellales bacterium]